MPKQKQRKKNERSLIDPLTPKTFRKEQKAASRLEFKPQQRQLQAESRANKEERRRINDYFRAYGGAVEKVSASSGSATQQTLDQLAGLTAASSATDESVRKTIEAEAAADAARRGAQYSASAISPAAASSRRSASDVFGGLVATQGASQARYLADKGRIGEGERVSQRLKSEARGRSVNADKRALAQAKGDFARDYRSRARETERQFYLEQQQLAQTARGENDQLKLARRYGKNKKREQKRGLENQLAVTEAQDANERADDRRADAYAEAHGGSKGGKDGSNKSIPPATIIAYVAQNATSKGNAREKVAANPRLAIREVLNRWDYLDPAYVRRVITRWANRGSKPTPGVGQGLGHPQ